MTTSPTLLGVDLIWVATLLSAVATFAVLTALYAATTVRDPMARASRRSTIAASN
jgi:tight adherence protein C